ncbi:MAG: FHIPEP family type III secretion protein, partial [Chloroflexi bacterium]|nr:FHIPEP family type III secretion protein [Chloroflexota bacterium]
ALIKGWSMGDSIEVFTRLTIGDGLVSQIPSFIIAIAAGLIVARTDGTSTIGEEIPKQLASQPMALYLVAGFLTLLAFTPLPSLPMLSAATVIGTVAWSMGYLKRKEKSNREIKARAEAVQQARTDFVVPASKPLSSDENK